jgi:hypothetical protein
MPFDVFYDTKNGLLRISAVGDVAPEDWFQTVNRVVANTEFDERLNILFDLEKASNPLAGIDFYEVAHFVRYLRLRFSGRVGIVSAKTGTATICHLIALSADSAAKDVSAFFLERDALEWFRK